MKSEGRQKEYLEGGGRREVKREQQTLFLGAEGEKSNGFEAGSEEGKEEYRAVKEWRENERVGFGHFGNWTDGTSNDSFGFQTGNFKEISIDQACLKQAMFLLQSQSQAAEQNRQYPQRQEHRRSSLGLGEEQMGFSTGFGFANGNGKSLCISASKLKQAQLLLLTQSDHSPLKEESEEIKSSPTVSVQKPFRLSSKRQAKKQVVVEQKTLQSHRKPFQKLLIVDNSDRKPISIQQSPDLIKYPPSLPTISRDTLFSQLGDLSVDLSQYQKPKHFEHSREQCQYPQCFLCSQGVTCITDQEITSLLCRKYGKQYQQKFVEWYHQVVFKLSKYTKYHPHLFNKQLNPLNIINQLEKKYFKELESIQEPFGLSLRNRRFQEGSVVNLVVMAVHWISKKQYYLLELSDGWYSLYAPVKAETVQKNNNYYLTNLIKKELIHPGVKIQIYGWHQYPIRGILEFLDCPNIFPCIRIMYNSLIKLPESSKLGVSFQIFYKQPSKCHPSCGLLSLYTLYLIRIIIDYKNQRVWFRLGNPKQTYLLHIHDGMNILDDYKEREWFDCLHLKMRGAFQFQNTNITKMVRVENQKGSNYIMKELLWNTCEVRHPFKPCDVIVRVDSVDEDQLRGVYEGQMIVVCMAEAKVDLSDIALRGYRIITEVIYLAEHKKEHRFKSTPLTKLTTTSSHSLYQALLKPKLPPQQLHSR